MVRLLVLFSLCLFIIPLAFAAPDVVFDKVISHGSSISFNGTTYAVQIGSSNDSLVKLVSSLETIIVDSGDCIEKSYEEFCYVDYDSDQKILANLTDYKPFIEIDREVSSKTVYLGEEITITLTFENTGGTIIDDFEFTESIPLMLTLIESSGCEISKDDSQKLIMDGDLPIDIPVVCEYVVKAGDVGLANYVGKLSTQKLLLSKDAEAIPPVVITAKNVFNLNISSSKYDLDMGQPFVLTFSIENIYSDSKGYNITIDSIVVDLEDNFLLGSVFDSSFHTTKNSKSFRFSGLIPPEEIWEQKVELTSMLLEENISVDIEINYRVNDDELISFNRVVLLTQLFHPLWCEYLVVDVAGNNLISLDKLGHSLPGFDNGEFLVYIYNDNHYVSFDDIRFSGSGDLKLDSTIKFDSLRKNDNALLTSTHFSITNLKKSELKSSAKITYVVMDAKLESSCNGDIVIEKPSFLLFEKTLSFENISIDEENTKLLPKVNIKLTNDFFLPINNIELVEILPVSVFSNNNTHKTISLNTLEDNSFNYNFVVPDDYVTLDGSDIKLETKVTYFIFDQKFSDSIFLTIDANDIISAQKGIILTNLIDTKIEQLKTELNDSLVASLEKDLVDIGPIVSPTTYSPFLDYFSFALIGFLFFLGLVFLNIHYGLFALIKRNVSERDARNLAKKEESFSKNYEIFKTKELSYVDKLSKGKEILKSVQRKYTQQEQLFRKKIRSLKSKELLADSILTKEQSNLRHLEEQKSILEQKVAALNRNISSQEAKKQQLEVLRVNEKTILGKQKADVIKAKEFVSAVQTKISVLDGTLDNMKSDFETDYSKNKSVLGFKLKKVQKDISHLDEDYETKRKILKEEEDYLEHRDV